MAALAGSHCARGGLPGQYQPRCARAGAGPGVRAWHSLPASQPPGWGDGAPPPLAPLRGLRDLFVWCHLHKNRTSVSVRSNAGGEILIDVSVWSPRLSERFDLGCLCCLVREMRGNPAQRLRRPGPPRASPSARPERSTAWTPAPRESTGSRLKARRGTHYDSKPGGLITSCQPVYVWSFPMLP